MAKRRMFSLEIIDTDRFLDMPATSQLLYFHLAMRADDDGFVASPKRIIRFASTSDDDLKLLVAKGFVIPFKSGVCVITHWKVHNYIKKDRYHETLYKNEKEQLSEDDNKSYYLETRRDTDCILIGSNLEPQVRTGKDRIDKSEDANYAFRKCFTPPCFSEVKEYAESIDYYELNSQKFIDFYAAKGWMIGKNQMEDWKAAIRIWKHQEKQKPLQPVSDNSDNEKVFNLW